jgi:divalent metal cation (Fe/Co/Zn/Cd) transporter
MHPRPPPAAAGGRCDLIPARATRSWQSGLMTRPGRSHLRRRAFRLEYVTVLWNTLEGVASIVAGVVAGSVSLVAFGLDSSVEVFASLVVIWELRGVDRGRERRALRLIGAGYLAVAAYVAWDASRALIDGDRPAASPLGMVLLAATVVVMVALGVAKLRVGRQLDSPTVQADGRFSLVDASLALAVLIGLALNAVLGWWWADGVLALLIALLAAREGVDAWRGRDVPAALASDPVD